METLATPIRNTPLESRDGWEASPPRWVTELIESRDGEWELTRSGFAVRMIEGDRFTVVTCRVPAAVHLDARSFQKVTATVYETILNTLQQSRAHHPVRLWNLIPGILDPLDEYAHRYLPFNAGRYAAYKAWFQTSESFACGIPTASGVGHPGQDLVVHCLATEVPGAPVENPRQISSYRYSDRYGTVPPCFARATRLAETYPPWLLVGGTASVRGEDTVFADDLQAQSDETFSNLAALITADRPESAGELSEQEQRSNLECYRYLRIYFVRQEDLALISEMVESHFTGVKSPEYQQAELCRPQLLIEIEGVAELPA
jgi:chorismate lyase/3-hydroxybenzoate synthase